MEKVKSEDNINTLCKKLFAPETCDSPVTESKRTLRNKIAEQLLKYGKAVAKKSFSLEKEDVEDTVILAITDCFRAWEKSEVKENYKAYFASSVRNAFVKECEKISKKKSNEVSLQAKIKEDKENKSLEDKLKYDEDSFEREKLFGRNGIFSVINALYRSKNRPLYLKAALTAEFYDEFHLICSRYPEERIEKYDFVDMDIFNLSEKPAQKYIAQKLEKDAGQIARDKKAFLACLKEDMNLRAFWEKGA